MRSPSIIWANVNGFKSLKGARMYGSGTGETEIKSRELELVILMLELDSDSDGRASMR